MAIVVVEHQLGNVEKLNCLADKGVIIQPPMAYEQELDKIGQPPMADDLPIDANGLDRTTPSN
jgi:hypothetical protein